MCALFERAFYFACVDCLLDKARQLCGNRKYGFFVCRSYVVICVQNVLGKP